MTIEFPRSHRDFAAIRALEGLSVGDAFGECFFSISLNPRTLELYLSTQTLRNWRWNWTDDTAMAISIVELLLKDGALDPDELATRFAARYTLEDNRGYGGTAHGILRAIGGGADWRQTAQDVMSGMGSMGNGGAMRAAPLGAFWADDPKMLVEQARISAQVTHAHPEGQAGAVAVALAAAFVSSNAAFDRDAFFAFIFNRMPDSQTRAVIGQAAELPDEYAVETAVSVLGNGSRLTAPDTVPFCLWCVSKYPSDFVNAMWTTVSGGGDMDTNCAIVGGVICSDESCKPPVEWLARREPLPKISA